MKNVYKVRLLLILTGVILMLGVEAKAVCGLPWTVKNACRVVKPTFSGGEFQYYQSYCQGDFPYCETWSGDCCSEPSYVFEGGSLCCDPDVYTSHVVGSVSQGPVSANLYKCCSRADYGNKSTWYKDENEKVHCCGGTVYQTKFTDSSTKTCCNHEFDEEGNVTRYYSVAEILGAPEETDERMCCATYGDAPGKYKSTAYWSYDRAYCCQGEAYIDYTDPEGNDYYGCRLETKGPDKKNKLLVPVGAPDEDEKICCSTEEYGKNPTAYWNTQYNYGVCCKGEVYQPSPTTYGCCRTSENEEHAEGDNVVVSVVGAPEEGYSACCTVYKNGQGELSTPEAYWNGNGASCCQGYVYEPYGEGTGQEKGYGCCTNTYSESATTCGYGVTEIINPTDDGYKNLCCTYYKEEDGTCDTTASAYASGRYTYCCQTTYISSIQDDGTKYYGCCDDEDYIKTAESSTRGVQACCPEGGTAFVFRPWSSYAYDVYWEDVDPEYGYTYEWSSCCQHDLANNAYGGKDCCTPSTKYDSATGTYLPVENVPTKVVDYDFEICCPKGASARYNGTTSETNSDTGISQIYPRGACCGENEVVLKYYKNGDDPAGYECCNVSEGSNRVRVAVQGAPEEGFEKCCEKYTNEQGQIIEPEAYWNGSGGSCCNGTVYETGNGEYACCAGTKNDQPTKTGYKVVSVLGAPGDGYYACCQYGEISDGSIATPTAYWSGTRAECCATTSEWYWDSTNMIDVYTTVASHAVLNQFNKGTCCALNVDQAGGSSSSAFCCGAGEYACSVSNVENKIACGEQGCATAHTWVPNGWITQACKPEKICKTWIEPQYNDWWTECCGDNQYCKEETYEDPCASWDEETGCISGSYTSRYCADK